MNRVILAALALACAFSSPALADAVTAAAPVVGVAPGVSVVPATGGIASVPFGDWIAVALQTIQPLAILLLTFAARTAISQLLPFASAFISDKLVESTVSKWVDYGINATEGAVKGKTLDVNTGSQVLATALNRATDRANASKLGERLMTWAGGPEEVANKIFRKLDLDPHAGIGMVTEAVQDMKLRNAVSSAVIAPATPAKF